MRRCTRLVGALFSRWSGILALNGGLWGVFLGPESAFLSVFWLEFRTSFFFCFHSPLRSSRLQWLSGCVVVFRSCLACCSFAFGSAAFQSSSLLCHGVLVRFVRRVSAVAAQQFQRVVSYRRRWDCSVLRAQTECIRPKHFISNHALRGSTSWD